VGDQYNYRPGEKAKVGYLLDDAGQGGNCTHIDELTSDWLLERLCALGHLERR
jgi:hypothetical protein